MTDWETLTQLLLRMLSKSSHYHGTIVLKYYDGDVKNVVAEDSYDLKDLNNQLIGKNNMFIKNGAKNINDSSSSSILDAMEIEIKDDSHLKVAENVKEEKSNKDENPTSAKKL